MGTPSARNWASLWPIYLLTLALTCHTHVTAQCQGPQIPSSGALGPQSVSGSGSIRHSATWDPDGPGPQPAVIVAVGTFDIIGQTPFSNVAMFDPAAGTWSAMPTPPLTVQNLLTTPNGRLFAMQSAGVYEFSGTNWVFRGVGPFVAAFSIGVNSSGNLVMTGYQSGAIFGVSEMVGNQWSSASPLPAGLASIRDITPFGTGFIARSHLNIWSYNGTTWSLLPTGPWSSPIASLATDGTLIHAAGSWGVATWDGTTWQVRFPHATQKLVMFNGDLIAAGNGFPSNQPGIVNIDTVQTLGGGISNGGMLGSIQVLTMTPTPNGLLFVGGGFRQAGAMPAGNHAVWDGTSWASGGTGWNGVVTTAARLGTGDLLVGGDFTSRGAGGTTIWDGQSWQTAGAGFGGVPVDMVTMPNGNVAVIGRRQIGSLIVPEVSVFDGSSWTDLSFPDATAELTAIEAMPDGSLVVGGRFNDPILGTGLNLMTWNGTWNVVPNFNVNGFFGGSTAPVQDLHLLDDGKLVVAGSFNQAGLNFVSSLAMWDGLGWIALPTSNAQSIQSVSGTTENNLVVAMANPAGILQRDGATWQTITSDTALDAQLRPDGFVSAVFPDSRKVWDGTTWQTVTAPFQGTSARIIQTTQGTMLVGSFGSGSPIAVNFQDISEACSALVTVVGNGCSPFGPPATLQANTAPWTGVTLELQSSGFPVQTFQLAVLSTTLNTVPLPQLTPIGLPGCDLHVVPDLITLASVGTSQATYDIPIPSLPVLAGMNFAAQFVGVEYYGAYVLAQATSSNALDMVIGTF